jgi:hypothetical protein
VFTHFSHFIAFGATDQETLRQLAGAYDGITVPGTIAAFQKQGAGGFVLSLSASQLSKPYFIDPRFPLFQQPLLAPKKSHLALAEAMDDTELISKTVPEPNDFPTDRLQKIASAWVRFNATFASTSISKFEKYAARLGETLDPDQAQGPTFTVAPYFVCDRVNDDWWTLSESLFELSQELSDSDVIRLIAMKSAAALGPALENIGSGRYLVWASGLNELDSSVSELRDYRQAIESAGTSGKQVAALYGGFFSILMGATGLLGSSHGIGFGEFREWIELPQTGPPPARFYLPLVHRYVGQEVAERLNRIDSERWACGCEVCAGRSPLELEYHDLMQHSVMCRHLEATTWPQRSLSEAQAALTEDFERARASLIDASSRQTETGIHLTSSELTVADHMPTWLQSLSSTR